jgi:hypothetical protein
MTQELPARGSWWDSTANGVVATDSAFLSVGFSLDVERLSNYCRDCAYNNYRRNGVRKAHGQKNVDRGYPVLPRGYFTGGNPRHA